MCRHFVCPSVSSIAHPALSYSPIRLSFAYASSGQITMAVRIHFAFTLHIPSSINIENIPSRPSRSRPARSETSDHRKCTPSRDIKHRMHFPDAANRELCASLSVRAGSPARSRIVRHFLERTPKNGERRAPESHRRLICSLRQTVGSGTRTPVRVCSSNLWLTSSASEKNPRKTSEAEAGEGNCENRIEARGMQRVRNELK